MRYVRIAACAILIGLVQTLGLLYLFGCAWTGAVEPGAPAALDVGMLANLLCAAVISIGYLPSAMAAVLMVLRDDSPLLVIMTVFNVAMWSLGIAGVVREMIRRQQLAGQTVSATALPQAGRKG